MNIYGIQIQVTELIAIIISTLALLVSIAALYLSYYTWNHDRGVKEKETKEKEDLKKKAEITMKIEDIVANKNQKTIRLTNMGLGTAYNLNIIFKSNSWAEVNRVSTNTLQANESAAIIIEMITYSSEVSKVIVSWKDDFKTDNRISKTFLLP